MAQRTISIFLSAPGDIVDERRALASLVSEINDVVTFLAPERNIILKLIDYQKDTFSSICGSGPQPVVNVQIPLNYDIHFGVMWQRCGTPTATADSGTVEEFDRALAQRQRAGRPTIMFYFSREEIGIPASEAEIDQLRKVVLFRQRLESLGLTGSYPSRAEFRERARTGLLRAIAEIIRDDLPDRAVPAAAAPAEIPPKVKELALRYDALRRDQPAGDARTRQMQAVFDEMKATAAAAREALALLQRDASAGSRLAAIAVLTGLPMQSELPWLAERLDPELEKPFVSYQAALALLQAVRSLPASSSDVLRATIKDALVLAQRNPNDPPRLQALSYALQELDSKSSRPL